MSPSTPALLTLGTLVGVAVVCICAYLLGRYVKTRFRKIGDVVRWDGLVVWGCGGVEVGVDGDVDIEMGMGMGRGGGYVTDSRRAGWAEGKKAWRWGRGVGLRTHEWETQRYVSTTTTVSALPAACSPALGWRQQSRYDQMWYPIVRPPRDAFSMPPYPALSTAYPQAALVQPSRVDGRRALYGSGGGSISRH